MHDGVRAAMAANWLIVKKNLVRRDICKVIDGVFGNGKCAEIPALTGLQVVTVCHSLGMGYQREINLY